MSTATNTKMRQQQAVSVITIKHESASLSASPLSVAKGQLPINDETSRAFHETHVAKKLLLILAMLVVIGQLVWWMGS